MFRRTGRRPRSAREGEPVGGLPRPRGRRRTRRGRAAQVRRLERPRPRRDRRRSAGRRRGAGGVRFPSAGARLAGEAGPEARRGGQPPARRSSALGLWWSWSSARRPQSAPANARRGVLRLQGQPRVRPPRLPVIASVGDVVSASTQLRLGEVVAGCQHRRGCWAVVTADRGQPGGQAGLVFIGRSDPVDRFGAVVVCLPTSALPGASRESRSFSCSGPIGLLQRRERRSWRAAPGRTPLVVSRR